MDKEKIVKYLKDDLKRSVVNDIGPFFKPEEKEGGFFAVPRLVLSYVDYLGVLYHGYNGKRDRHNRRIFSQSLYAKDFLRKFLGSVDNNYKLHGELLWEMYRNGTIHLYAPKVLKDKSSRIIGWIVYKGPRVAQIREETEAVIHLVPHRSPGQLDHVWQQPISIDSLYGDLISAIEGYAGIIPTSLDLQTNFRKSADALVEPEETDLTW